ncbi:AsnC family transcriptional regulator [Streptomyces sp. NPDC007991]|uniref:AsnC family transcriptional regulator n=1 Tax=Streptomyces sp. NPDC007991 TaxID=3364803 RepID=UPI0036E1B865
MLTIERTVSGHDIFATVATRDLAAMSRYTLDHLPAIKGVTAVRARIVTHMFIEAGRWRIDALAPGQRARLTAATRSAPTGRDARQVTPADRAVLAHLAQDGRASYQTPATALGTSASTVKRRIDHLTGLGLLGFRCDFARPLGGRPVAATFRARVAPASLPDLGHALIRLPQTRNCAAISGPSNLILQATIGNVPPDIWAEPRGDL